MAKKEISQIEQAKITLELIEFKTLLRIRGISGKDMAKSIGLSYGGYRSATKDKAVRVPVWVRSFMLGCNLSEKSSSEKNRVLRTDEGGDVRDWSEHPRHDEMVSGMTDGFKGITVEQASKALQGFGVSTTEVKKSWKDNIGS